MQEECDNFSNTGHCCHNRGKGLSAALHGHAFRLSGGMLLTPLLSEQIPKTLYFRPLFGIYS